LLSHRNGVRLALRGPACVEDIDYRAPRGLDKTVVRALAKDSTWVRNHENIFVIGLAAWARASWRVRSHRKLVAMATGRLIFVPQPCCVIWAWLGPTAACAISWHD